jgi:hypothetical protein
MRVSLRRLVRSTCATHLEQQVVRHDDEGGPTEQDRHLATDVVGTHPATYLARRRPVVGLLRAKLEQVEVVAIARRERTAGLESRWVDALEGR